jgi:opacity protein-like surface antigen
MKNLLTSIVFACSALLLAPPALAGDALDQAKETAVQDARSNSRNKSKSKSKNKRHGSSRRHGSGHSAHSGGSNHSSHSTGHRSSHSRYRHPGHTPVVVHHSSHRRHVVRRTPVVVVHPSSPARDRVVNDVDVRRRADKAQRFSIGLSAGVAATELFNGETYANLGVEGQARYRIADPLGVEVTLGYFGDATRQTQRTDVPFSASVMVHTPGYIPVGAFAYAGVTLNYRDYDLTNIGGEHLRGGIAGPHVGAGLNVNLGPSATLEWDVRYTHFLAETGERRGGAAPGQLGSNVAVNFFF